MVPPSSESSGGLRIPPWLSVVLVVLGVAFLVRAGVVFHRRLRPSEPVQAPPRPVEVICVEPTPFAHGVPVSGTLSPVRSAMVFPKVGGRVTEIHVELGQRVEQGDPLADVEAVEWELQARKAEEGLAMARQAAELAARSVDRLEAVREQAGEGALSEQSWEQARLQAESARSQAELTRLDRDLARRMVENSVLTAPVSGWVSKIWARLGNMVGQEYPTFQVDDDTALVLYGQVGATDLPEVATGQAVALHTDTLPGETIEGTVAAVSPTLDSVTRRGPVEIDVPNPERRITGNVFARGWIVTREDPEALVLPMEVIERTGETARVYVAQQGRARRVPVTVVGQREDRVAVEGLSPGDRVVVPGAEHLVDGEAIEVVEVRGSGDPSAGAGGQD